MFLGRKEELKLLNSLKLLDKSSLVVCRGRRRIGKSTLINQFAKSFKNTVQIQGLAPHSGQTSKDQLDNFMEHLCLQVSVPFIEAKNWNEAFNYLAAFTKDKAVLIFLDEISWMAQGDRTFPGKLKIAWDTKFSQNKKLILVLCGSITSWIDQNILGSTDFVGRISTTITLKEIELSQLKHFFKTKKISNYEALKMLSITGGVPRYLEEINPRYDAATNISKLCFKKEGVLFSDFDKIFQDTFNKRASTYKDIVQTLTNSSMSSSEISKKLKKAQSGIITKYLEDLCESGFLRRSFTWNLLNTSKEDKKLSLYSISDNYLRFYLKFILPFANRISDDLYKNSNQDLPIKNIDSILGLQLENLILNNIMEVIEILSINPSTVENFGPYFQKQTTRQKACQVDLLIQTSSSYYICEIKFRKKIGLELKDQVQQKISKLKLDRKKNIKTVLFFAGDVSSQLRDDDYFDFKIEVPKSFWQKSSYSTHSLS